MLRSGDIQRYIGAPVLSFHAAIRRPSVGPLVSETHPAVSQWVSQLTRRPVLNL